MTEKQKKYLKIGIQDGYRGLKRQEIEIEKEALTLITGENGCGKSTLLRKINIQQNSTKNERALLKSSISYVRNNKTRRIRKNDGFHNVDYDTPIHISEIKDKIAELYSNFLAKKYNNNDISKLDFLRCLFDQGSYQYKEYRKEFLSENIDILYEEFFKDIANIDDFREAFGIPTHSEIKETLESIHLEDIQKTEGSKRKENLKEQRTRAKQRSDNDIENKSDNYKKIYNKLLDDIITKDKWTIKSESSMEDQFKKWIDPFSNMLNVIATLSSIIQKDFFESKKKAKIFHEINNILNGMEADGKALDNNNNELSENIKALFKYNLKEPNRNNDNYELIFVSKNQNPLEVHFDELSTGEKAIFELICYIYILNKKEVNKKEDNKIKYLLLDEFDSNLNPKVILTCIKIIQHFLTKGNEITVIMTTHNASTVAYVEEENLFWMEDGLILQKKDKKEKMDILTLLCSGTLSTLNVAGVSDPYLMFLSDPCKEYYIFCEGPTDIIHFKTACKELGGEYLKILSQCNFQAMFGTENIDWLGFLHLFAKKDSKRKAIAILDRDKAGHDVLCKFDNIKEQYIAEHNGKITCLLLQIEDNEDNNNDYTVQRKYGHLPIELLYKKSLFEKFLEKKGLKNEEVFFKITENKDIEECYIKIPSRTDSKDDIWQLKYKKINETSWKDLFCEHIKNCNADDFTHFKPTLDAILKIINKKQTK